MWMTKNDLETKAMRLKEDFLGRAVTDKAMDLQLTRLEEEMTKLMADNESVNIEKQEIFSLPMSSLRP